MERVGEGRRTERINGLEMADGERGKVKNQDSQPFYVVTTGSGQVLDECKLEKRESRFSFHIIPYAIVFCIYIHLFWTLVFLKSRVPRKQLPLSILLQALRFFGAHPPGQRREQLERILAAHLVHVAMADGQGVEPARRLGDVGVRRVDGEHDAVDADLTHGVQQDGRVEEARGRDVDVGLEVFAHRPLCGQEVSRPVALLEPVVGTREVAEEHFA